MDIDVFSCVLCHYQKKVLKSSFSEKQEVATGLEKLLEALYVVAVVSLKVLGPSPLGSSAYKQERLCSV